MPFRARFDCLWCGSPWSTAGPDDLEGWTQLCPACLGKAGSNPFLRGRLRAGIEARAAGRAGRATPGPAASPTAIAAASPTAIATSPAPAPARRRPPRAQPAFPDDWFLRRGAFSRGAVHDTAWAAELDVVTRWLDGLPLSGRIEEPAAGVGFFSPLLAGKGELHATDVDGAALDLARRRLVAHGLLAHLHVADPWVSRGPAAGAPGGTGAGGDAHPGADAVLASFLLGRVRRAGLEGAAASLRARLRTGGRLSLIDLRPDPAGGPPEGVDWTWHDPDLVEAALARAGFASIDGRDTGRFFRLVVAEAA